MKLSVWIEAARLRTLPASLIPVLTGGALAWNHGLFNGWITLVTLLSATLIQIGTNFANDYFDFRRGADTKERVGFTRASSTGAVAPQKMLYMAASAFFLAFLLGILLVCHAGWLILLIGLLSITSGILYTGGPFPLAYNGLGDIFVFLFFGIIAVMGTYFVNTLQWSSEAFWASIPIGALSTMILVVNNYRDVDTDRKANKKTLVVLLGEAFSRWHFAVLMGLAFAIPPHFFFRESYALPVLLPLLLLPWGIWLVWIFWNETKKEHFNAILVKTARFMTFFGVFFALGILLSA